MSFNGFQDGIPDPLSDFLDSLPQMMHLGAGNEDVASLPGVQASNLSGPLQPDVFSYSALCTLTGLFETNTGIAHARCAKLDAAEAAEARGNHRAKAGALDAYRSQMQAQAGKSLTREQAHVLIALFETL